MTHLYRTWIEISKSDIKNNYLIFKKLIKPKVKILGVVKSNAYGHELFGFANSLIKLGVDWLGVDSITEAIALRKQKIKKPILVLGYTLPSNFLLANEYNITLTISSFENLYFLKKFNKNLDIHLKIDTGMHRQGFFVKDLPEILNFIKHSTNIRLKGVYTHFAAAKRPDATHATGKQIQVFKKALTIIKSRGFTVLSHASATAGTLNYPEAHFDMVRVGIGLYGLWPSPETEQVFKKTLYLRPVLTWKTIISEIKTIEKGEKIGYDYTEELKKTKKIAILPIGYWHGYFRSFSSSAFVLVKGIRCKILGRVAMDMVVIDVTDVLDIKVGDEVVLMGSQGKEVITADELANLANTTSYEVVTKLNPLIKKIYK